MPGYHTGPVAHIGHLVGSRHSHLDGGGYGIDQSVLKGDELLDSDAVMKLLKEEVWRQILSSLTVCFFARGIYDPDTVINALNVAGYDLDIEDLDRIGLEILRAKNRFKLREGFDPERLRIPSRIFETPSARGYIDEKVIRESIKEFFDVLTGDETDPIK
jgi:aldehyde:ferredoxin oxidoreductase